MEYQQASGIEDDVQKIRLLQERTWYDESYYWWNVELTLHFSPCCMYNSGYKSPKKNKVKWASLTEAWSPRVILALSLSLSFFIRQRCPSWEYPWTLLRLDLGTSLSFTISWSLLKLMFIESVMPSNHSILCHPLLILLSIFPNIRVFFSELALHMRWPKSWSFNFSHQSFQWIFRVEFL